MGNVERPRYIFKRRGEVTINIVPVVNGSNNIGWGVETNPFHSFLAFIFYVLVGFLQISYPDNPTAFHVHPKTIRSLVWKRPLMNNKLPSLLPCTSIDLN
ncbi:hypothetical protein RYX36_030627 [Vicia faba]